MGRITACKGSRLQAVRLFYFFKSVANENRGATITINMIRLLRILRDPNKEVIYEEDVCSLILNYQTGLPRGGKYVILGRIFPCMGDM